LKPLVVSLQRVDLIDQAVVLINQTVDFTARMELGISSAGVIESQIGCGAGAEKGHFVQS